MVGNLLLAAANKSSFPPDILVLLLLLSPDKCRLESTLRVSIRLDTSFDTNFDDVAEDEETHRILPANSFHAVNPPSRMKGCRLRFHRLGHFSNAIKTPLR